MDFILQEHVVALLSDNQLEGLLITNDSHHVVVYYTIPGQIHYKMIIGGAEQGDFDCFISELFQLNFGAALKFRDE